MRNMQTHSWHLRYMSSPHHMPIRSWLLSIARNNQMHLHQRRHLVMDQRAQRYHRLRRCLCGLQSSVTGRNDSAGEGISASELSVLVARINLSIAKLHADCYTSGRCGDLLIEEKEKTAPKEAGKDEKQLKGAAAARCFDITRKPMRDEVSLPECMIPFVGAVVTEDVAMHMPKSFAQPIGTVGMLHSYVSPPRAKHRTWCCS